MNTVAAAAAASSSAANGAAPRRAAVADEIGRAVRVNGLHHRRRAGHIAACSRCRRGCELADIPVIDTAILAVVWATTIFCCGSCRSGATASTPIADYAGACVDAERGALGHQGHQPRRRDRVQGQRARVRAGRRGAGDAHSPRVPSSMAVQRARRETLRLPHPLHLHCSQSGHGRQRTRPRSPRSKPRPGISGCIWRIVQFYAYGTEGQARLLLGRARAGGGAERGNRARHRRCRPGDVRPDRHGLFGRAAPVRRAPTRQAAQIWSIMDGDGNGGGIVPYRYRRSDFHNAVQWAAGLELFLLNRDPWRLFFTTDHPNGAPFTAYPDLLALLMSRRPARRMDRDAAGRGDGGHHAAIDPARIHAGRDRDDDPCRPGAPAGPGRSRASGGGRGRRRRGLSASHGRRGDVPRGGAGVQGRPDGGAATARGRFGHVRPRAGRARPATTAPSSGAWRRFYDETCTACQHDAFDVPQSEFLIWPHAVRNGSAMTELTRNGVADRRHLRRGVRHGGHRPGHDRPSPRWARQAAVSRHGLRHLDHRLRRRGRHRRASWPRRRRRTGGRACASCCSARARTRSCRSSSSTASGNAC